MHFGGAIFFTDYSMSAPELARASMYSGTRLADPIRIGLAGPKTISGTIPGESC
jgi:hypothetical protein